MVIVIREWIQDTFVSTNCGEKLIDNIYIYVYIYLLVLKHNEVMITSSLSLGEGEHKACCCPWLAACCCIPAGIAQLTHPPSSFLHSAFTSSMNKEAQLAGIRLPAHSPPHSLARCPLRTRCHFIEYQSNEKRVQGANLHFAPSSQR